MGFQKDYGFVHFPPWKLRVGRNRWVTRRRTILRLHDSGLFPVFPRFRGKHTDVTLGQESKICPLTPVDGNTKRRIMAVPLYNDTVRCTPSLTPLRTGQ